jgi:integrase/recombinase XerD
MQVTISIVQDLRRAKEGNKFPVKLRVTYQRKQKYFPLGVKLTEEEYVNIKSTKTRKALAAIKFKLIEFEAKANRVTQGIPDFSFRLFERKYFERSKQADDIFPFFEEKISKLTRLNRIGTAVSYQCTMNSLKLFSPIIGFKDISEEFLCAYEKWNVDKGNSITTVGIYLRTLRAIFNDAIAEEVISRENYYPFGNRKYKIPTSRNTKKALSLAEIKLIFGYSQFLSSSEEMAVDFWKFSYLCNGMNMKDIVYLKFKNIDGEFIKFRREKTKETSRADGKIISVFISDAVKEIIFKWSNKKRESENYIFAVIDNNLSEEQKRKNVKQLTKLVNKYMKRVAGTLKIDKPVTSYYARHSYATVLKRSGASVEFISESLGHSSVQTTASYLDSFEDDMKKEFAKKLLEFK